MANSASPRHRYLVGAMILSIAGLVVAAAPSLAHTEVQRAEPGPASEVSDTIDEVSLLFLDQIQPGGTIEVTNDAGRTVEGLGDAALDADRRTLRVGFEPLEEPGTYVVNYSFVALDGDAQQEAYTFTFLGAGESDGVSRVWVVATGMAVIVAAVLVVAIRRRRQAVATHS